MEHDLGLSSRNNQRCLWKICLDSSTYCCASLSINGAFREVQNAPCHGVHVWLKWFAPQSCSHDSVAILLLASLSLPRRVEINGCVLARLPGARQDYRAEKGCCGSRATYVPFRLLEHQKTNQLWTDQTTCICRLGDSAYATGHLATETWDEWD